MNNQLLQSILENCKAKRSNAILIADSNKKKALNIADFEKLNKQEQLLTIEIGKLKFENKSTENEQKEIEKIKKQKQKVLKKNGFDEKLLTPNFSCKICNNTGFNGGKLCSCIVQEYNNTLMQEASVEFASIESIENLKLDCYEENVKPVMQKIATNLCKFAQNINSAKTRNIVLIGNTGVGKTYLAKSVAKTVMQNGNTVLFTSAFNLNNEFLKSHLSSSLDKIALLQNYINADLLVIDDLGTEPILKNVTKEYLLLIINERINKQKATIITTNLQPDNLLSTYNERIYSRIFNKENSACFNLVGKDLRIK